MRVARQGELRFEFCFVEFLLLFEVEGGGRQKAWRRNAIQRRGGRNKQHIHRFWMLAILRLQNPPQRG